MNREGPIAGLAGAGAELARVRMLMTVSRPRNRNRSYGGVSTTAWTSTYFPVPAGTFRRPGVVVSLLVRRGRLARFRRRPATAVVGVPGQRRDGLPGLLKPT